MMEWGVLSGIAVIVGGIVLYEWPRFDAKQRKEKAAFLVLLLLGVVLASLLLFFPDLPGPTQLIDAVFRPLGKYLEK
ncbi:hypothetical protein BSNK01_26010 [Bacillaceae bacterium]